MASTIITMIPLGPSTTSLATLHANFEVIDIVDNTTPYPTLLGLDLEFDN
jgi:hypothetical protein